MALSSHLEGVLNGMFLVVLGLLWPHIDLPEVRYRGGADRLPAYANWLATLLAAAWGAGRTRAHRDRRPQSPGRQGGFVSFLLSLSVAIAIGVSRHHWPLTATVQLRQPR